MDTSANAFVNTGRPLSSINPMIAEVAFLCYPFLRIELHHSKRAGFDTGLTPDANLWIDENNAIGPLMDRINRTNLFAGRVGTVKAASRIVGEFQSTVYFLDPFCSHLYPTRSFGRIILLFTGYFAGIASPAEVFIDDHCKFFSHV
jgi:hypothetical protein